MLCMIMQLIIIVYAKYCNKYVTLMMYIVYKYTLKWSKYLQIHYTNSLFTMNNFQETIFFSFNQKKQSFHVSTFESIRFRNGIKHYTVKKRTFEKQNFLNFFIWNITFFSLLPLVSASVASFVNKGYDSHQDLYDALLNTFFPIFFVILLNVSQKPGSIKNVLLPLLDDVLYNVITWMIPLIVSFSYDDLMIIKIFSIVNMCLHVFYAVIMIILTVIFEIKVADIFKNDRLIIILFLPTFYFLLFFPVIVIPIFWMIILTRQHAFDSISIIFLTLFGICLFTFILLVFFLFIKVVDGKIGNKIIYTCCIICFYAPNFLQTLLVILNWPINFYFVKAFVFILVLSLTRNVFYFTDNVPDNFLATSTAVTQCLIKNFLKKREQKKKGAEISI